VDQVAGTCNGILLKFKRTRVDDPNFLQSFVGVLSQNSQGIVIAEGQMTQSGLDGQSFFWFGQTINPTP